VNVFLVETPHQLLNALEARSFFRLGDNHLVVIVKEEYSRDSFKCLVDQSEWRSVSYLTTRSEPESRLLRKLRDHRVERIRGYYKTYELYLLRKNLDSLAKSFQIAERVFLGNYLVEYMRHFANVLSLRELCLLDDGTTTLLINKVRRGMDVSKKRFSLDGLKQKIINFAIKLNDRHIKDVTFFTIFDFEVRAGDRLIKHNYPFLRKKGAERPVEDVVYFLGMSLIDEGLSQESYLNYLRKVVKYFSNERLVYIQHWEEPSERLKVIEKDFNLKTIRFKVPIEHQISVLGNRPKIIASFCSSALEKCRIIFGDLLQINAFYIDPEDCPLNPGFIRDIYAYYRSRENLHFRVFRL
jgi:hypothetical protein